VSPEVDDVTCQHLELEELICSSPLPDSNEPPYSSAHPSPDENTDYYLPSLSIPVPTLSSLTVNGGQNKTVMAWHLAIKIKLSPYQCGEIEEFATVNSI
jgi:hypothetical protein